jgi:hypothetical protein
MNFSDAYENALDSICFKNGGDSNNIERKDWFLKKHDEQRRSTELGIQ